MALFIIVGAIVYALFKLVAPTPPPGTTRRAPKARIERTIGGYVYYETDK